MEFDDGSVVEDVDLVVGLIIKSVYTPAQTHPSVPLSAVVVCN